MYFDEWLTKIWGSFPPPAELRIAKAAWKGGQAVGAAQAAYIQQDAIDLCAKLSPREREALLLITTGCPRKEVASRMQVSGWTVNEMQKAIYSKLGVHRSEEAAALAAKAGLV